MDRGVAVRGILKHLVTNSGSRGHYQFLLEALVNANPITVRY